MWLLCEVQALYCRVEKTASWSERGNEVGRAVERLASWYLIPMLVHLVFSWQLPSLKAHIKLHWLQAG